jgi:hypothetical protein
LTQQNLLYALSVRLSCDEPRDQERQRDGRREDENNAKEEDDHRPPRERRIVVADRREEALDGVSQAEAPSVGGRLREGHPLGGVWSVQRALTRRGAGVKLRRSGKPTRDHRRPRSLCYLLRRCAVDRERRACLRYLAVCSVETVLGADGSCRRRVAPRTRPPTPLHHRVVE